MGHVKLSCVVMAKLANTDNASKYCFKIILLGEYNVGKSSIFYRFKGDDFKEDTRFTIGIDSHSKLVSVKGENVTLMVWDTVGTERFRTLTRNYYRNAHGCLLVFTVDEPETLSKLAQWAEDADNYAESALKVLVANKVDNKSCTSEDKVRAFAHHYNCDIVFSVSAKTGQGIDDMFAIIAEKLISRDNHSLLRQQKFFEDVHTLDSQESKVTCC